MVEPKYITVLVTWFVHFIPGLVPQISQAILPHTDRLYSGQSLLLTHRLLFGISKVHGCAGTCMLAACNVTSMQTERGGGRERVGRVERVEGVRGSLLTNTKMSVSLLERFSHPILLSTGLFSCNAPSAHMHQHTNGYFNESSFRCNCYNQRQLPCDLECPGDRSMICKLHGPSVTPTGFERNVNDLYFCSPCVYNQGFCSNCHNTCT